MVEVAHTTHVEDHNTWRHRLESVFEKDLLKCLSRQGVDEDAFSRCAELAKRKAYPNANGAQMQTSIASADEKLSA